MLKKISSLFLLTFLATSIVFDVFYIYFGIIKPIISGGTRGTIATIFAFMVIFVVNFVLFRFTRFYISIAISSISVFIMVTYMILFLALWIGGSS